MNLTSYFQTLTATQKIILILIIGLLLYNARQLWVHVRVQTSQTLIPLEPGLQFSEFRNHLKGVREVGFLTDNSTQPEFFFQTQYYLAPTVVKYNQPQVYNIVDSVNSPFILKTIIDNRSIRLSSTEYGQALIVQKQP